ncbi:MAG: class I SAM-dependent methyltransferase [Roseovarius sp.]|uniref:class I SAM-dependent DNA methyltransferase n=1 Tax=Roseovarius sp. TaxID=1486281 RepID=UPI0032EDE1EA
MSGLGALAGRVLEVYERNAARYDRERSRGLFERGWLDRFAGMIPEGGRVLDVGCGTGAPLAEYLTGLGFAVTGVDGAAGMIEIAWARRPEGDWRVADMRRLALEERFDGVLAWDSFFHLTRDEQRQVVPRLLRHLRPGGPLMLTVGPGDGEVIGQVGDEPIYHASLDQKEYARLIEAGGAEVVDFVAEDPTCDFHSVLLARKL